MTNIRYGDYAWVHYRHVMLININKNKNKYKPKERIKKYNKFQFNLKWIYNCV